MEWLIAYLAVNYTLASVLVFRTIPNLSEDKLDMIIECVVLAVIFTGAPVIIPLVLFFCLLIIGAIKCFDWSSRFVAWFLD